VEERHHCWRFVPQVILDRHRPADVGLASALKAAPAARTGPRRR
jgi:hypothetical protein